DKHDRGFFRYYLGCGQRLMFCRGLSQSYKPKTPPATLSPRIITDLLRTELVFDGLVMTDDLDMGAILTGYRLDETIRLAIGAGNDVVMFCHRIPEVENFCRILGTLPSDQLERALKNVASFK